MLLLSSLSLTLLDHARKLHRNVHTSISKRPSSPSRPSSTSSVSVPHPTGTPRYTPNRGSTPSVRPASGRPIALDVCPWKSFLQSSSSDGHHLASKQRIDPMVRLAGSEIGSWRLRVRRGEKKLRTRNDRCQSDSSDALLGLVVVHQERMDLNDCVDPRREEGGWWAGGSQGG